MSELRVLLVTGEYPPRPGGIGDYTARLRAALEARGARMSVLTLAGAAGERIHPVQRWGWRTNYARVIAAEGAGVVHIQYQAGAFAMHPSLNALPARLRRGPGIPVVTTFHDLLPPYLFPKAGRLRALALRAMARHSAAVVATNPADERALARAGLEPVGIPIGPNLPPPSGAGDPRLAGAVAFFGFPARSKGILELIEALGQLPAAGRPALALIGAAGSPSARNDHLADAELDVRAADAGVRLLRTGYLAPQAASDALAGAAVVALPFRDGASQRSGSLLAALQCGRPVVSTLPARPADLGALRDAPQLLLAPRGDAAALAGAIVAALAQPPAAGGLPPAHDWDDIARRHLALYERVLRDGRRP